MASFAVTACFPQVRNVKDMAKREKVLQNARNCTPRKSILSGSEPTWFAIGASEQLPAYVELRVSCKVNIMQSAITPHAMLSDDALNCDALN
jgi:hypothetical protein